MTRAQLAASRVLWLVRERYRYAKWHGYHATSNPLAGKWWTLYQQAHDQRMNRDRQLAALDRPRTISSAGIALIASFEGFVGHPYRDAVGVWTIGYGHTAGVGPNTPDLTQAQAQALLRRDLEQTYVPPVRRLKGLNQPQFDALVSVVYNLGPGVIGPGHTLGDYLARGDLAAAANAILLYDKAGGHTLPGLTRRRKAERALFVS